MKKKMTALLNENIQPQVHGAFLGLRNPVHILYFGSQQQCQLCAETLQLVEEITKLSDVGWERL